MPESIPLVKKYNPTRLDDIVGQVPVVTILKRWVDSFKAGKFDFPNLLFIGPPGCGKTATAKAFARELYGDDWAMSFRDYNASDEVRMETVRVEIKNIAKSRPFSGINIIFMDEADNINAPAQYALRRIMEDHYSITRFILSANYPSKIIPPIRSRCGELYFGKLSDDEMKTLLRRVVTGESYQITAPAAELIIKAVGGKPRNLLNLLNCVVGLGKSVITPTEVNMFVYSVPEMLCRQMWSDIEAGKVPAADLALIKLSNTGTPVEVVIDQLFDIVAELGKNHDKLYPIFAEYTYRMAMGASPLIQARALLWECGNALKEAK